MQREAKPAVRGERMQRANFADQNNADRQANQTASCARRPPGLRELGAAGSPRRRRSAELREPQPGGTPRVSPGRAFARGHSVGTGCAPIITRLGPALRLPPGTTLANRQGQSAGPQAHWWPRL
jgi:hypothetical protein